MAHILNLSRRTSQNSWQSLQRVNHPRPLFLQLLREVEPIPFVLDPTSRKLESLSQEPEAKTLASHSDTTFYRLSSWPVMNTSIPLSRHTSLLGENCELLSLASLRPNSMPQPTRRRSAPLTESTNLPSRRSRHSRFTPLPTIEPAQLHPKVLLNNAPRRSRELPSKPSSGQTSPKPTAKATLVAGRHSSFRSNKTISKHSSRWEDVPVNTSQPKLAGSTLEQVTTQRAPHGTSPLAWSTAQNASSLHNIITSRVRTNTRKPPRVTVTEILNVEEAVDYEAIVALRRGEVYMGRKFGRTNGDGTSKSH